MNTVKQMLKAKGNPVVWTILQDASVLDAVKLMRKKQIGSVVVMDGEAIAGIFTERDFTYKVERATKKWGNNKITDMMTREVITVSPKNTVNDCMVLMTDNHIRHLPVVKKGELVGMISIGDVVKDRIDELQFRVNQMENYITGTR